MTTQTTAVARVTPQDEIKNSLVAMRDTLPLPKHIDPDRFIAVAQMAIVNMPSLVSCDRNSLYAEFTKCAQAGLFPDGREAAIVPFAGKAKLMVMVAGIMKQARNSGEISVIDSKVVYENDTYEYFVDEKGPHFKFVPARSDRGKPILTFAYALAKDGGCFFEEIDETQMNAIRAKSKASDSPWRGPFEDEMRRKSALRRLGKYRLPNSSDLDTLFKQDDELYDEPNGEETAQPEAAPTPKSRLHAAMEIEPEPEPSPTVAEAVATAKEVFPGAKEVAPRKENPPKKTGTVITGASISGLIADIKGKGERIGCALSVDPKKYYGTSDKKIGEQMAQALDSKAEVTITYQERKTEKGEVRDILSFVVAEVAEEELPI